MTPLPAGDVLLGRSLTRRRILALLLDRPGQRLHLRAIARAVATSAGTASRELRRLEATGLVASSREGARVYYQANEGSRLIEPVRALLREGSDDNGRAAPDAEGLAIALLLAARLPSAYGDRVRGVYLYGSRARGDHQPDSDVDILIVLDRIDDYGGDLRRSSDIASELSLEHGLSISRVLVPEAVWTTRDRPFVRSAARDAIAA